MKLTAFYVMIIVAVATSASAAKAPSKGTSTNAAPAKTGHVQVNTDTAALAATDETKTDHIQTAPKTIAEADMQPLKSGPLDKKVKTPSWAIIPVGSDPSAPEVSGGKYNIYSVNCALCHGDDAKGRTESGELAGCKDHSTKESWKNLRDEDAIKTVLEGIKDEKGQSWRMPAYKTRFVENQAYGAVQEMKALAK